MKTSLCLLSCLACGSLAASAPDPVQIFATAPLRFEVTADSGPPRYVARGTRFHFSFTALEANLQQNGKNVRLRFQGANRDARIEPVDKLRSTTNLYLGNDSSKWRRGVANYGKLQVQGLYPGIDLVYYGNAGELEYDLTVRPNADPRAIRLRLNGGHARVDSDGNLIAGLIQKHPVAYQIAADGSRMPVESRYSKNADGTYGFTLGSYDWRRELVIDPVLTLSAYVTGSSEDISYGIGHDKVGFLYIAGTTQSTDITLQGNSFQATQAGTMDLFIAKVDPNAPRGTEIVYFTYFGGASLEQFGGMTVSPNGDVYVTGATASQDFPLANAAQGAIIADFDAFVAWFDPSQNLAYSSYLGGSANDIGIGVNYDSNGLIYVTGGTESDDFPYVTSGYQMTRAGLQDAFVTVFDPHQATVSTIIYSTYIGGGGWDIGRGIAKAPDGTVWVVGATYSFDFPLIGSSFQKNYATGGDAFAIQLRPNLAANSLLYTTFLGGSGQDEARNILIDPNGRIIISGWTLSTDFPVTLDALQRVPGGDTDVFVAILSSAGQLVYATYFGGPGGDSAFDLKQDSAGSLYLAGFTLSPGLAVTPNALQSTYDGNVDGFVLKFDPSKPGPLAIQYLSYLGGDGFQTAYGVDFDPTGKIFLTGFTSGPIFDALGGSPKTSAAGNRDAFVLGFKPNQ
jgi:hypothetical protein